MTAKLEALNPVSSREDVPPHMVLGVAVGTIAGNEYTPMDWVVVEVQPFNVALKVISLVEVSVAFVDTPLLVDKEPPLVDQVYAAPAAGGLADRAAVPPVPQNDGGFILKPEEAPLTVILTSLDMLD